MTRHSERGIALVLVLLAAGLLSAIAAGMLASSTVLRVTAVNVDESTMLLNAAEAALELASRELALLDLDDVLSGARASPLVDGAPGVRSVGTRDLDLRVLTDQLTCGRSVPCAVAQVQQVTRERPWGANNPRWQLFIHQFLDAPDLPGTAGRAYVVVWIGDDARETDGDPARDGAGGGQEGRYVVRARAEAFGVRGGRRGIEAELARSCMLTEAGEECLPGSRVQSWRAMLE